MNNREGGESIDQPDQMRQLVFAFESDKQSSNGTKDWGSVEQFVLFRKIDFVEGKFADVGWSVSNKE